MSEQSMGENAPSPDEQADKVNPFDEAFKEMDRLGIELKSADDEVDRLMAEMDRVIKSVLDRAEGEKLAMETVAPLINNAREKASKAWDEYSEAMDKVGDELAKDTPPKIAN